MHASGALAAALILILSISSARALAHGPPLEPAQLELEEVPTEGINPDQLRALIHDAHHSIEGEEGGAFFRRWRDNFRIRRFFLNAYRWYSMHEGRPEVANASANIAAMLITSHTLETIGGLALASGGASQGWGDLTSLAMAALGVTITIPGLDPLCLVLIGAYGKWPETMNFWLTYPRLFVVRGTRATLGLVGLTPERIRGAIANYLSDRFVGRMVRRETAYTLELADDRARFILHGPCAGQNLTLTMNRNAENGSLALAAVESSPISCTLLHPEVRQLVKPFGANIAGVVSEIKKHGREGRWDELRAHPYIQDVERRTDGTVNIRLASSAFPFHTLGREQCQTLLAHSRIRL